MKTKEKIELLESLTGKKVMLKENDESTVIGDLKLTNETLSRLDNLKTVKGSLDLTNCTNLTSLPEGLKVYGNLYLNGCINLKNLPKDIKIGDCVFVARCSPELVRNSKTYYFNVRT